MTWIIKKVNRIPTHCGVAYESVRSLARGPVIRVCKTTSVCVLCGNMTEFEVAGQR